MTPALSILTLGFGAGQRQILAVLGALVSFVGNTAAASTQDWQEPPAVADEPLAKTFSAQLAAQALDTSARLWQRDNQCVQCHANMLYGFARPLLDHLVPTPPDYRGLVEGLVTQRWKEKGLRYPMEPVVVSLPLVLLDSQSGGKLTETTRQALERMLSQQRADGSWSWNNGAKRSFWREYEGVMLAALTLAQAPEGFSGTPPATQALERIRSYAKAHPPASPYAQGWLLWAGHLVDGLATEAQSEATRQSLLAPQGTDGGWAIENLVAGSRTFEAVQVQPDRPSDGYGIGFAIKALREGGLPATDPRLQRGIAWLKTNQRASGRWFVPSLNGRPNNVLSNSSTAFAIMALAACGEIPKP